MTQLEGIEAHVGAEHRAAPREAEEVAELASPAAAFEHTSAVRDLLVEETGELTMLGFGPKLLGGIKVVVVGKGRFLVERLDDLRDVDRSERVGRPEEPRNASSGRVGATARLAADLGAGLVDLQRAAACRAHEDGQVLND